MSRGKCSVASRQGFNPSEKVALAKVGKESVLRCRMNRMDSDKFDAGLNRKLDQVFAEYRAAFPGSGRERRVYAGAVAAYRVAAIRDHDGVQTSGASVRGRDAGPDGDRCWSLPDSPLRESSGRCIARAMWTRSKRITPTPTWTFSRATSNETLAGGDRALYVGLVFASGAVLGAAWAPLVQWLLPSAPTSYPCGDDAQPAQSQCRRIAQEARSRNTRDRGLKAHPGRSSL